MHARTTILSPEYGAIVSWKNNERTLKLSEITLGKYVREQHNIFTLRTGDPSFSSRKVNSSPINVKQRRYAQHGFAITLHNIV